VVKTWRLSSIEEQLAPSFLTSFTTASFSRQLCHQDIFVHFFFQYGKTTNITMPPKFRKVVVAVTANATPRQNTISIKKDATSTPCNNSVGKTATKRQRPDGESSSDDDRPLKRRLAPNVRTDLQPVEIFNHNNLASFIDNRVQSAANSLRKETPTRAGLKKMMDARIIDFEKEQSAKQTKADLVSEIRDQITSEALTPLRKEFISLGESNKMETKYLRSKIDRLKKQMKEKEEKEEKAAEGHEQLRAEISSLRKVVEDIPNLIQAACRHDFGALRTDIEGIRSSLEVLRPASRQHATSIEHLQSTINSMEAKAKDTNSSTAENLELLRSDVTLLQDNSTVLRNGISEVVSIKWAQTKLREDMDTAHKKLQEDVETAHNSIKTQQADVKAVESTLTALEESIVSMDNNMLQFGNKVKEDVKNTFVQVETRFKEALGDAGNTLENAKNKHTEDFHTLSERIVLVEKSQATAEKADRLPSTLIDDLRGCQTSIGTLETKLSGVEKSITGIISNDITLGSKLIEVEDGLNKTNNQQKELESTVNTIYAKQHTADETLARAYSLAQVTEGVVENMFDQLFCTNNQVALVLDMFSVIHKTVRSTPRHHMSVSTNRPH
jgi:chromosome segregation ATPase